MQHLLTDEDKPILIIVMLKQGNGPSVKVQQFSCTAAKIGSQRGRWNSHKRSITRLTARAGLHHRDRNLFLMQAGDRYRFKKIWSKTAFRCYRKQMSGSPRYFWIQLCRFWNRWWNLSQKKDSLQLAWIKKTSSHRASNCSRFKEKISGQ